MRELLQSLLDLAKPAKQNETSEADTSHTTRHYKSTVIRTWNSNEFFTVTFTPLFSLKRFTILKRVSLLSAYPTICHQNLYLLPPLKGGVLIATISQFHQISK
jgi:hypothetical protein